MDAEIRVGERMVLPKEATLEDVASLAERAGFEPGPEQQKRYVFERVWAINGRLTLHYISDSAIGISYLMVMGDTRAEARYAIGLVGDLLSAPDVEQLVAAVEEADDAEGKADAIMRLAIGMPTEGTSRDALRVVLNAYDDSDPIVRRAAIVSALFLKWEDVEPYILKLEKEDPVEHLRHEARYFLVRREGSS